MTAQQFSVVHPCEPAVAALIDRHLAHSVQHSVDPADDHALDAAGLADPSVTLFGLSDAGLLTAIVALKRHDRELAELKGMHVAAARRGTGLGRRVLDLVLAEARRRGYRRVSLETGTQPGFAGARALYRRAGFVGCAPFADYRESPNSVYLSLALDG